MMDCSKTEVFFAEWQRMCEQTEIRCAVLDSGIAIGCGSCEEQVFKNYKKAIQIIQEWSDSHPEKTRLSVFLEQYPNCRKYINGRPHACAGSLYGVSGCIYDSDGYKDCNKCWNTPIEDGGNNA